jgi:pectate lyase
VPAFPGAEGAGRYASGGRGGEIVHVTNLKADGPGSLADAVSRPNRIVVFDVSGTIDLTLEKNGNRRGGHIVVDQPNITIAGQTAPGEGICLKGGSLDISASNVIVRHLRSRRGWIADRDTGDAIEVKPPSVGEQSTASGTSTAAFEKRKAKKAERGKLIHEFDELSQIVIDHCSTSWATDENLTVTHADRSTVSWCIAAEGCDYYNAKQTPPNHSEGSLWGSPAPDGRATMHHMLYAHNRLRNPRTTGGEDVPPVLNFYNSVVYNWSEYASHTGGDRVLLNWLNNYYKAGLDTPPEIRGTMFEFHGDPGARIFARGNLIDGAAEATADNKQAIGHNQKFKKIESAQREATKVDAPFADAPAQLQSAAEAYAAVLDDVGATLPARDPVDLRITAGVRNGTGRILGKETDLASAWPTYHSLPKPADADGDGIPDFWEAQFDLNSQDATDAAQLSGGYANIEHYFNSTDPRGGATPVVFIAATISRARHDRPGEWRIVRNGNTSQPLAVSFTVGGDATSGKDYAPLSGSTVTIPAGKSSVTLPLVPVAGAGTKTVVVSLITAQKNCHVGCPAESLVVIEN